MEIVSINVGQPTTMTYEGKELETGIFKQPVEGAVFLSKLNFAGDGQADLKFHGGVDKAVCVYSHEHYPFWERELNRPMSYGAFGENLTVTGMTEDLVCIGDTYQLGEAVVQVTQPRQPCHKLAKRYDVADMPVKVQNVGFTGFYFRVLQEGHVSKEDRPVLIERHPAKLSVAFANQIMHHDKKNQEGIRQLLAVEELSASWRKTLSNRLEGNEVDTSARLNG
ncbi:MOSC domain-containing protein [Brevibacillus fluminis]|uniref:MOSC domain-containing protein n=1 Tax=Brevibacillus fluminis TaxID=511487 RepID=UPI003F8AA95A